MTKPTLATITHDGCKQMAAVLEGVAGTLHGGAAVPRADLQDAVQSAQWIWNAGPESDNQGDAQFEDARIAFVTALDGGSRGQPREGSILQRSAKQMAGLLRLLALESEHLSATAELPMEVGGGVSRLAQLYSRNARSRNDGSSSSF